MEERRDDGGWWDRLGEPRHTSPVAADQLRRGRLFVGRVCVCRAAKKSQKVTTPAGVNWPLGLLSVLDGEPVCVLACVAARQTCGGWWNGPPECWLLNLIGSATDCQIDSAQAAGSGGNVAAAINKSLRHRLLAVCWCFNLCVCFFPLMLIYSISIAVCLFGLERRAEQQLLVAK